MSDAAIFALQARERRRAALRRWAPWVVFAALLTLAFLVSFAATAHAQDGLYRPQPIPAVQPAPLTLGGLMLDADSIVEMDTTMAVQYFPSDAYAAWFQEDVACGVPPAVALNPLQNTIVLVRVPITLRDLAFVAVDAPAFRVHGTGPYVGYTAVEHGTIILPRRYIANRQLVRHELLHAILWSLGRPDYGHPEADPIFRACGLLGQ